MGRLALRLGLVNANDRLAWRREQEKFFTRFDVLITPTLAATPIEAAQWSRRSWFANVLSNMRYAPFTAPWNFAGFPAAAVPAGFHSDGMPLSVQLVAPAGQETRVLAIARQLEILAPWPRHAPLRR
jgi:amidase